MTVDPARVKATELAVELLRGSVPESVMTEMLRVRQQVDYEKVADGMARRLGRLVKSLATEIERSLR